MLETDKIYHGDCKEVMATFPDDCIDLTVTSPPYDNLRSYNGYTFDFEGIAKQLYRVTKKGGVVVWVIGDETINGSETGTSFKHALYFMSLGFNLHDTMIWNKGSCRYPEINRYYPTFEYMFVLSKGKPFKYNLIEDRKNIYYGSKVARKSQMRKRNGDIVENSAFRKDKNRRIKKIGVRYNIWNIPVSSSGGDKIALKHPASFSQSLANDHIISWSNKGDLILDPMCGSGTVPKMAIENDRKYIGIEISEKYLPIIESRIKNAQPNMF